MTVMALLGGFAWRNSLAWLSSSAWLGGLARAFAFGRHMPATKLARRMQLHLRRRWSDSLAIPALPLQSSGRRATTMPGTFLPMPVFAPRPGALVPTADGQVARFLNREIVMPAGGIDWSAPGLGASDQLWRMNLHYMEYLETLPDSSFQALIADWIAGNPPGRARAWRDSWNSYALSLRVVVWMQQLAKRWELLPPSFRQLAADSLGTQIIYLERNLETDIGGNHFIKNIKALIWASAFFAGAQADRWRRLGLRLLAIELDTQILADGMQYERSASYHAQVFADLLECRSVLGPGALNGRLDATLRAMALVTADLAHPDGGPVLFNDSGLGMAYAPRQCLDVFAQLSGSSPAQRPVFALPHAGYYGLRQGRSYLVADCGRIAPDDLPAHGHGDVLSFEWSVDGKRIVVDQGVFEYSAGSRRQAARSARSHNTVWLAGADQADFFGAFRCGRRPNVSVRHYRPAEGGFDLHGSHDGFAHLAGAPVHVRQFEARADSLKIVDRIEGETNLAATAGFLLHPDVAVSIDGRRALLTQGQTGIELTSSEVIGFEPAVWWPDMGQVAATFRLLITLSAGSRRVDANAQPAATNPAEATPASATSASSICANAKTAWTVWRIVDGVN